MGRQSKLDAAKTVKLNTETATQIHEMLLKMARILAREGFWIGLMANAFWVSGTIRITNKGGTNVGGILDAQRRALVSLLDQLESLLGFTVPLLDFAPMKWSWQLLKPFQDALKKTHDIGAAETDDEDKWGRYWTGLPIGSRFSFTLILPGALRVFLETLKGTVELSGRVI